MNFAEIERLKRSPEAAYDEYGKIRQMARNRNGGLVDHGDITRMRDVIRRHGRDWCQSVIGKPMAGGLESISTIDATMLMIADEQGISPPKPGWLVQWQAEAERIQRGNDRRRAVAAQQDEEKSAAALAALATVRITVEIRVNRNSTTVRHGERTHLVHIVPAVDVRSPKRLHQAGIPLCERPGRWKPRNLSGLEDAPVTCVGCLKYATVVRPLCDWDTGSSKCGKSAQWIWTDAEYPGDPRLRERPVCGIHARSAKRRRSASMPPSDIVTLIGTP